MTFERINYSFSHHKRNDNVVDPLTKPLPQAKHESHIRSMGIGYNVDWA